MKKTSDLNEKQMRMLEESVNVRRILVLIEFCQRDTTIESQKFTEAQNELYTMTIGMHAVKLHKPLKAKTKTFCEDQTE